MDCGDEKLDSHMAGLFDAFASIGHALPKRKCGDLDDLDDGYDLDDGCVLDDPRDGNPAPQRRRLEELASPSELPFLSCGLMLSVYGNHVYQLSGHTLHGHTLRATISCTMSGNSLASLVYTVGGRETTAVPLAGDGGSAQEIADKLLQTRMMGCRPSIRIDMLNSGRHGNPVGHVILLHLSTPYGDQMTELAISNVRGNK